MRSRCRAGLVAASLLVLTTIALAVHSPAAPAVGAGKKLVIIAPAAFHAVLAPFVAHKQTLLPTEIVALETVLKDHPGADDPEMVKHFLYDEWKQHDLGYALLVGDVDVMPVRYMVLDRVTPAAFDYAFYPSDLYYADLAKADGSFEDWNAQKEGFHAHYFGEVRGEKNKDGPINYDRIHYLPKIAVGRWPVGTPEQAAIVAKKSIQYEEALLKGDKPGLHTAALFAVDGWVDARGRLDGWAQALKNGWHVEKRFYGTEGVKPPTEKELYSLLHEGCGLVIHAGHGSDTSWEKCCSARGVRGVKNGDRLPVMVSAGCSTAHFAPLPPYEAYTDVGGNDHKGTDHGEKFDAPPPPPSPYQRKHNPTGLGEIVLRSGPDGAVAYIGCNTGSQPCGLTLVEGFVLEVAKQKEPRLGDCWASAVRYYYGKERLAQLKPNNDWYPPSIFFQGMKFMLFGDPSLRLPGGIK